MANRYDDRGRIFGRIDEEPERWDRGDEDYAASDWNRGDEYRAAEERERWENDWDRGTMDRSRGRGFGPMYGRFGPPQGAGSAAGYTGFGGSGGTGARERYEREREIGPYAGRGPKGYQRSDERIREDVSDRLTDDDRIDASTIEVAVAGGEVTLAGTVESRRMKRHAEDLAESVRGVRDVHNQLRIGAPKKEDHELSLTPEAEQLRKQGK